MSITTMRHLVDLLLRAEWSANKRLMRHIGMLIRWILYISEYLYVV